MLDVVLPMPPSSNRLYFVWRRGGHTGIALSTEGKAYKSMMADVLLRGHAQSLATLDQDAPQRLVLVFNMRLFNKGYPEKAKTRYRKIDLSNRILLLENGLKDVTGIDDSQNFELVVLKEDLKDGEESVRLIYGTL